MFSQYRTSWRKSDPLSVARDWGLVARIREESSIYRHKHSFDEPRVTSPEPQPVMAIIYPVSCHNQAKDHTYELFLRHLSFG